MDQCSVHGQQRECREEEEPRGEAFDHAKNSSRA
jgi:hypothetical protein